MAKRMLKIGWVVKVPGIIENREETPTQKRVPAKTPARNGVLCIA